MTKPHTIIATSFALAALVPSAARAGTYEVRACDAANGVNNSWAAESNNGQLTAYNECPSGGNKSRGMVARTTVGGSGVPPGSWARLIFHAPGGTTIVGVRAGYRYYRGGYTGYEAALSDGTQVLAGCSSFQAPCDSSSSDQWIPVQNRGVIYSNVFCARTPCPTSSTGDPNNGYVQATANLFSAVVTLQDDSPPSIGSFGGDLWGGGWKRGTRSVSLDASDNSGISRTRALIDGQLAGDAAKPCDNTRTVPCPQGGELFSLNTVAASTDGAHSVTVQAFDAAGNMSQETRQVHIDNTPPAPPQQVQLDGGDGWRSTNSFKLQWSNPSEPGTAPVAGAEWEICRTSGKPSCQRGQAAGGDLTSADKVKVPDAGDYTLKLWLRDAAGNADARTAAEPVHLRFDDEAPRPRFTSQDPDSPTRLVVNVEDDISGLGGGTIEMKRDADDAWQPLETRVDGNRLIANIDDEHLRRGVYDLRARATDRAGNEKSTTAGPEGGDMKVSVPVRVAVRMRAGAVRRVGRRGKRRTTLRKKVRVGHSRRTRLRGRLTAPDGSALANTDITVLERRRVAGAQWVPVTTLHTSTRGGFSYLAPKGVSRVIRFRYPGTARIRPVNRDVALRVAAGSTVHLNRHRFITGETATFTGRLRGGNIPPEGKLVELQVKIRRRFRTFATTRADNAGRWRYDYKFDGTRGVQRYVFRVRVPREATYPYETGLSRRTRVVVRGL